MRTLGDLKVGSALKLGIMREGKAIGVEITLTERPVPLAELMGRRSRSEAPGVGQAASRPADTAGRAFIF